MPAKTNSDLIIELKEAAATLAERLDRTRDDLKHLQLESRNFVNRINEIDGRLARIDSTADNRQAAPNRAWLLWASILAATTGAIVGSLVTFLLQSKFPSEPPPEALPGFEQRQREMPQ